VRLRAGARLVGGVPPGNGQSAGPPARLAREKSLFHSTVAAQARTGRTPVCSVALDGRTCGVSRRKLMRGPNNA
jgi:hypothetical protein